nr:UTRA domain-containing protein [Corynebacterium confusum]
MAETERVWSVKRLHTVDGTPALYSRHFVPASDLQAHWAGREPASYRQSLEPALPNAVEQKALRLSRTTPILRVQRCALDAAGRPLDFTEMALRGDVAELHLDI